VDIVGGVVQVRWESGVEVIDAYTSVPATSVIISPVRTTRLIVNICFRHLIRKPSTTIGPRQFFKALRLSA
jgi:hypothetical protein